MSLTICRDATDGVVRWRLKDLALWIYEDFGISLDETTVGRELKAMGFRKLSPRPRHYAQNCEASDEFKKLPRRTGGGAGLLATGNQYGAVVAG